MKKRLFNWGNLNPFIFKHFRIVGNEILNCVIQKHNVLFWLFNTQIYKKYRIEKILRELFFISIEFLFFIYKNNFI
jgi:hypothetical protein